MSCQTVKATNCHPWSSVSRSSNDRYIIRLAFAGAREPMWAPECIVRGTVSKKAKLYIVLTALAGLTALKVGLNRWQSDDAIRFICYFLISTMASGCQVNLPGVTGTMSVNFLFILIGIVELRLPESMLIALVATLFQSFWKSKTLPMPVQVLFNVSNVAVATMAAYYAYHISLPLPGFGLPVLLVPGACVYFVTNTFSVAIVISLTEGKRLGKVWKECYFWSFPYYMAGAAISGDRKS